MPSQPSTSTLLRCQTSPPRLHKHLPFVTHQTQNPKAFAPYPSPSARNLRDRTSISTFPKLRNPTLEAFRSPTLEAFRSLTLEAFRSPTLEAFWSPTLEAFWSPTLEAIPRNLPVACATPAYTPKPSLRNSTSGINPRSLPFFHLSPTNLYTFLRKPSLPRNTPKPS